MLNAIARWLTARRGALQAGQAAHLSSGHSRCEPLDLASRRLMRIDGHVGQRIRCIRGLLWITQDGDLSDVILGPGQVLQLHHRRAMLVFALQRSQVALDE